jgi:PTH1 family peptidyl-tRNA hydrolase
VLGLGNPGPDYEETRHNAGFLLADRLAERWGFDPFRREGRIRVTRDMRAGQEVHLIKPQTYMNRSGAALAPLRALPDFSAARDLLVLVDDVALDVGRFRLRGSGSAGGHNGLKSIETVLGEQDYARLRIGVGPRPFSGEELADYVLDRFNEAEREAIEQLLDPMVEAVDCWLEEGIERAMSRFNKSAPLTPDP